MPCPGDSTQDSLYLLEVMIKEVHYAYSRLKLDPQFLCSLRETMVFVKFLHYPALEIIQDACDPLELSSPVVKMGNGKSCLFSLNKECVSYDQPLCVNFNVVRKCPPGGTSKYVGMGKASVDVSKKFMELLKQTCSSSCPSTKCIEGCYQLTNDACVNSGSLSVFMRLSCFGSQITTHFKMSDSGRDSFIFKGDDIGETMDAPSEMFKIGECSDQAICGQKPAYGGRAESGFAPSGRTSVAPGMRYPDPAMGAGQGFGPPGGMGPQAGGYPCPGYGADGFGGGGFGGQGFAGPGRITMKGF